MEVSGVWGGLQAVRSSAGAAMAASGHVPVADDPARRTAAERVLGARGAGGEAALGGRIEPVHGAV